MGYGIFTYTHVTLKPTSSPLSFAVTPGMVGGAVLWRVESQGMMVTPVPSENYHVILKSQWRQFQHLKIMDDCVCINLGKWLP